MKRIMSFAAMLLVALTTMVSFTSCEDEAIAQDLEGTWKGNMYISKMYNSRKYTSTYTEIEFSISPFKSRTGTGYWVDHYSGAPWDYVANHIDWSVRDGRITIYFREEGTTMFIDDYSLSANYFSGYIIDGDNRVSFSLTHTYSPNWDSYRYWDSSYWYSKTGSVDLGVESRSTSDTSKISQPERFLDVNK